MRENEFFVVDLVSCQLTGEIINSLSLALETLKRTGKQIVLKLSDIYLNQSQLLSIQSLITSYGCTLDTIETSNKETASIAENMNITVKLTEENNKKEEFQRFEINTPKNDDGSVALKDVNGLHFEADLDAIQKQQQEINISSDLREIGISRNQDFADIEKKFAPDFSKIASDSDSKIRNYENSSITVANETKINIPSSLLIDEPSMQEALKDETETKDLAKDDLNKNSIGIYKKAYEEEEKAENWDEIDFYETPINEPLVFDTKETKYINQTLRSGQVLESSGNVVIIGDCHPGSEIKAVGDITVWGVLSGIAHAGCKGNENAKIRALKMNAVQLRIASCYSRRPDGTNIPYILRSSIFTPEEARVVDGEIVLFKVNQN